MEEKILKLLLDYSFNGKIANDLGFVYELVEIVVNTRQLENYIIGIEPNDFKSKDYIVCATYTFYNKKILVDFDAIAYSLKCREGIASKFDSIFKQNLYRNIVIAQYILHELEHALQFKKADDQSDNSLEAELIRASFKLEQIVKNPNFLESICFDEQAILDLVSYIQNYRSLYNKYYEFNPTEKMAEVNSYKTIIASLESIKKEIIELSNHEIALFLNAMLTGYSKALKLNLCPTQIYLDGTNQKEKWKNFDFYDEEEEKLMQKVKREYGLEKRLMYGLPITHKEYSDLDKLIHISI